MELDSFQDNEVSWHRKRTLNVLTGRRHEKLRGRKNGVCWSKAQVGRRNWLEVLHMRAIVQQGKYN